MGDVSGELASTFNIDLTSSPGKIKVSKKLGRVLSHSDLGSKEIQDITSNTDTYWIATNGKVYKCDMDNDPTLAVNWTEETAVVDTLDLQTTFLAPFNGAILISDGSEIHRITDAGSYTSAYWTSTLSGTALDASYGHHMHVHRGGQETLVVCDKNKIRYYNATAGHSTITIDDALAAHCVDSGTSAVWAGTFARSGEYAYVYEFYIGEQIDAVPVARNAYKIGARAVFAIAVAENIPYIINELGELQAFNGASFVTVAQLPFSTERTRLYGVKPSTIFETNSRPVNPNGMKVQGDTILIYINTREDVTNGDPANERSPSGIWEYNIKTGVLNHRFSTANSSAEYGSSRLSKTAPLYVAHTPETLILAGGGKISDADTGLFAYSTATPSGYFTTPEIEARTVQENFERITLKAKTLASGESILVKYRTSKNPYLPAYADITWTSATTFTTTDTDFANIVAADGNEVEVVSGYGAGHLAHITGISYSNPTYTVTIDRSVGSNAQTARIRVDNWIKIDDPYVQADGEFKIIGINVTAPWIQFKVSMTGNIELRRFMLSTNQMDDA